MNSRYICRKELAALLELSVRSIKNNELRWGLKEFRADANSQVVRYRRGKALARLKELRVLWVEG